MVDPPPRESPGQRSASSSTVLLRAAPGRSKRRAPRARGRCGTCPARRVRSRLDEGERVQRRRVVSRLASSEKEVQEPSDAACGRRSPARGAEAQDREVSSCARARPAPPPAAALASSWSDLTASSSHAHWSSGTAAASSAQRRDGVRVGARAAAEGTRRGRRGEGAARPRRRARHKGLRDPELHREVPDPRDLRLPEGPRASAPRCAARRARAPRAAGTGARGEVAARGGLRLGLGLGLGEQRLVGASARVGRGRRTRRRPTARGEADGAGEAGRGVGDGPSAARRPFRSRVRVGPLVGALSGRGGARFRSTRRAS